MSVFEYTYESAWSPKDGAFIAHVAEFPSLAAHSKTRAGSLREIKSVIDSVVKELAASGEKIPVPAGVANVAKTRQ